MKKQICVEALIADKLREFLNTEKVQIEVVTGGDCDISIVKCDDHKESNLNIIYSGGWVTCGTALALAKKLEVPAEQMGKLLNYLDVKIRRCSLGCFK